VQIRNFFSVRNVRWVGEELFIKRVCRFASCIQEERSKRSESGNISILGIDCVIKHVVEGWHQLFLHSDVSEIGNEGRSGNGVVEILALQSLLHGRSSLYDLVDAG